MWKKWKANYLGALNEGEAGICPQCQSNDTGYVIVQNPSFIEVWCNNCGAMDNMSFYGVPEAGRNVMSGDKYKAWQGGTKHHQLLAAKIMQKFFKNYEDDNHMKEIIITYNPDTIMSNDTIQLCFKDEALTVSSDDPLPGDIRNLLRYYVGGKKRKKTSTLLYRYRKELPLTETLAAIHRQLLQIDYPALLSERQKYDDDMGHYFTALKIGCGDHIHSTELTLERINHSQNKEARRLHELMKSLFAEIKMEDWYYA
jgi:hypothetical protein